MSRYELQELERTLKAAELGEEEDGVREPSLDEDGNPISAE